MADTKRVVVAGGLARSRARLVRLKESLRATAVCSVFVHFIDLLQPLNVVAEQTLLRMLPRIESVDEAFEDIDGTSTDDEDLATTQLWNAVVSSVQHEGHENIPGLSLYYVTPRAGTISPWSSQATAQASSGGLQTFVKRIERGTIFAVLSDDLTCHWDGSSIPPAWTNQLYDRMTQEISVRPPNLSIVFGEGTPCKAKSIKIRNRDGSTSKDALQMANTEMGLALDTSDLDYLVDAYDHLGRDPMDVELFMFAQVNSEHCRHKQFNADWTIDDVRKAHSLFGMIRNTHKQTPEYTISAYSDNAAVIEGESASLWVPDWLTGSWAQTKEKVHILGKVETHNHPTAVSPYPGAATGAGGEIRDEGSVGRGSQPQSGLVGYTVSPLLIPGHGQPWELDVGKPSHIASSLDIMLDAPIGGAHYNNEFGRPVIRGDFRTFLQDVPIHDNKTEHRGYHKPIMIAGGTGRVRPQHALKPDGLVQPGAHLLVLGGPAMLIGLGGGAASSIQSGEGSADLDFASVQRGNPEVQRRVQEVITTCTSLGSNNPIQFIHDVGAGGLSNALPELAHDAGVGATFDLRKIDNADKGMGPLEIWCCEAQERYVIAVAENELEEFEKIAKHERCGYSVVGRATGNIGSKGKRLILYDNESEDFPKPIDLPMDTLFGKPPKLSRVVESRKPQLPAFGGDLSTYLPSVSETSLLPAAIQRVLNLPAVASKAFLITIGDRSVGGLVVRDQMVGPWQVPVADVGVTALSLLPKIQVGTAMATGEKPPLALISPAASARMAVAESLMNLAAADIELKRVKLSANWMCASNHPGEGAGLYEAVEAIGMELCPELGISIPVGKDSMSMAMKWKDPETKQDKQVTAPLSVVITAFGPVRQIARTWTPTLRRYEDVGETLLLFVDLAEGRQALGGSALAQVFSQIGNEAPDIRDTEQFKDFFDAIEQLHESGIVLAYHDRSDGGLFTTLVEMMFAGRCGLDVMLDQVSISSRHQDIVPALFNEELGAVFQVRKKNEIEFQRCFATCGPPPGLIKRIGRVTPAKNGQHLNLWHGAKKVYTETRANLQRTWASTSYHMQKLRDNAACAKAEFANIIDDADPGLSFKLTFDPKADILPKTSSWLNTLNITNKPRVAILREQGTNGQAEMAFAFSVAGFAAIDVHMTDLISGRVSLASFVGMAACGGFSYGDVLGAGRGWANSVLSHPSVLKEFMDFFERNDTFTLGVCNGCQFLSHLRHIIPGASTWPSFKPNVSEQYEARVCMVSISDSPRSPTRSNNLPPSVFLHGMNNSTLPIVTAHGEGRVSFARKNGDPALQAQTMLDAGLVPFRYTDNRCRPTEAYPYNPNGSPLGVAGVRTPDGRVLAMMPHPERTVLAGVGSYVPAEAGWRGVVGDGKADAGKEGWGDSGPWVRLFKSARRWIG